MKCNYCGDDMKVALYCSEGLSEKLIILDKYDPATGWYGMAGKVMYCPGCGNLQVDLNSAEFNISRVPGIHRSAEGFKHPN